MQTQCVRCLLAASSSSLSQTRGASTFPVAAGRRRRRSLYLRRVASEMEKVDNADSDDVNNNLLSIQLIRTINASKQNSDDESSEQRENEIFALMDALEREQEDVEKDLGLVDGTFSLLFTGGATDASEKEREQKEGKIGSFVTKVTGSSSTARKKKTKSSSSSSSSNSKNFQIIDLENERVENRADLLVFNRVPVSVRIFGSCVRTTGDDCSNNSASSSAAASLAPSATRPRFSVCFTHAKIEVFGKERVRVPLERFNARGWIDVTYVDDLIRLGVGDKGSRFLTARLKKSEQRNNPE